MLKRFERRSLLLGATILFVGILVTVQTPWGVAAIARLGLRASGLEAQFVSLRGFWMTSLEVRGLELVQDDFSLHVDTLRVRHHAWTAIGGHWRVRSLNLVNPELRLYGTPGEKQNEGDEGDQSSLPAPKGQLAHEAASANAFELRIDVASISGGKVVLPDSSGTLSHLSVQGRLDGDWHWQIDTLDALLNWAGASMTLAVAGSGEHARGATEVDTLSITGSGVQVAISGQVDFGGATDLRLHATPLHLAALSPLIPESDEKLTLSGRLQGIKDSLHAAIDGAVSDGGRLTVRARGSVSTRLIAIDTLLAEQINPALFMDVPAGKVTADLTASLRAESYAALTGRLDIAKLEGTLGRQYIGPARLSAQLSDSTAYVSLETWVGEGQVVARGNVRPFEESIRTRLEGEFRQVDTGFFLPGFSSNLNGGFSLESNDAIAATVNLEPGSTGRHAIAGGSLVVWNDSASTLLVANVRTADGLLIVNAEQGKSGLSGALFADNLDVAAILNLPDTSQISGSAILTGTWPPDSLRLRVSLDSSAWRDQVLHAGEIKVSLNRQDLDFDLLVEAEAGHFQARGQSDFSIAPTAWTVADAQFSRLDAGALGVTHRSDLNGTLSIAGRGFRTVSGVVSLTRSAINEQVLDSGRVTLDMHNAKASLHANAAMQGTIVDLSALADDLDTVPVLTTNGVYFENLDLGALLGDSTWTTRLTGRLDSLSFTAAESPSLVLQVDLDSSRVNELDVRGGSALLRYKADTVAAHIALELPYGHVHVDTLRLGAREEFAARGSVQGLDLQALADVEAVLSGTFDVAGRGVDLSTMTLSRGNVDAGGSRFGEVAIKELDLSATMQSGRVTLDTLKLQSNIGNLYGGGALALHSGEGEVLRLHGRLDDARPLAKWLGPVAAGGAPTDQFWVRVDSRRDTLRYAANLALDGITYGDVRILNAEAAASGYAVDFKPAIEHFQAKASRVSVPALAARGISIALNQERDTVRYAAQLSIDDRRSARLSGYADRPGKRVVVEDMGLRLDQDDWHLEQPAEILVGDAYRIRNLLLVEDDQEVALDGVLDFDGQQNLGLSLYNVQLDRIADLFGYAGLGGTLDGDFFLSGPAASPKLSGSLNLQARESVIRVGDLSAQMHYSDNLLALETDLVHADGSTLSLSGSVPLDLRLDRTQEAPEHEVAVTLQADAFNVGWITPFLNPEEVADVKGRLTASMDARGTTEAPRLSGHLSFYEGNVGLPLLGLNPSSISIRASAQGDTVEVHEMSARSGRGQLAGTGRVVLESFGRGGLEVAAQLDDFRLVDTRAYVADVDGDLQLRGTLARPELTGHVEMTGAVIRPQDAPVVLEHGPVTFTEADLRMLEQYFNIRVTERDTTTYNVIDAMAMDLSVGVPGNVWLRSAQNPEMNVLLSGSVALTKAPLTDQELVGSVSIVPQRSYLRQFGRRFDIRSGRVSFAGPATDPYFDLQAAMKVPDRSRQDAPVSILMEVSGRLQDASSLSLELRSEPIQLDRADIISYIATGRPAADAFQLAGGNTLEAGSDLALRQFTNLVAGAAGAEIGLDIVQIQQEGSRGVTVTAGKYVSRRLFASVSWPVNAGNSPVAASADSNKELLIEYALYSWMLAQLRGDAGALGLSLLYQYTW